MKSSSVKILVVGFLVIGIVHTALAIDLYTLCRVMNLAESVRRLSGRSV